MMRASLLAADDAGDSPTSCSARVHSPSFSSYSSQPRPEDPLGVGAVPLLAPGLGLQSIYASPRRLDASRGEQLPALIEERLRDLLGEPLSDVDRACVQLMPLRSCLPGRSWLWRTATASCATAR